MSFTRGEVLASHELLLAEGIAHSVVPEVTDIQLDPDSIVRMLGNGIYASFAQSDLDYTQPRNHLRGSSFTFVGDEVDIHYARDPAATLRALAESSASVLRPIDRHFRTLAEVPDDQPTEPVVNLLAGVFSGRAPSDTNRHFDLGARQPVIEYKIYFLGDPRFSSVYYPGDYRLPSRAEIRSRGVGAPNLYVPKPLFSPKNEERAIMPPYEVCIEPWNAYHSGPTDKRARRQHRGILSVSYDLTRLSLSRRASAQAAPEA